MRSRLHVVPSRSGAADQAGARSTPNRACLVAHSCARNGYFGASSRGVMVHRRQLSHGSTRTARLRYGQSGRPAGTLAESGSAVVSQMLDSQHRESVWGPLELLRAARAAAGRAAQLPLRPLIGCPLDLDHVGEELRASADALARYKRLWRTLLSSAPRNGRRSRETHPPKSKQSGEMPHLIEVATTQGSWPREPLPTDLRGGSHRS